METQSKKPKVVSSIIPFSTLSEDILLQIFSYFSMYELCSTIPLVSQQWYHLSCNNWLWKTFYENKLHLQELISTVSDAYENYSNSGDFSSLLNEAYLESSFWKPNIVREFASDTNNPDEFEDEDENVDLKTILSEIGEPLTEDSFIEQFRLVRSRIDLQHFIDTVKELLHFEVSIPKTEEQLYRYKQLCKEETEQISFYKQYMEEITFDGGSCFYEDSCTIFDDAPEYLHIQLDKNNMDKFNRIGLGRLSKQAGIKYFTPFTLSTMETELKQFVRTMIQELAKKNVSTEAEIVFEQENYSGYFMDDVEQDDEYGFGEFAAKEQDKLDQEWKIKASDVAEAFYAVTNKTLYGYPTLNKEKNVTMENETVEISLIEEEEKNDDDDNPFVSNDDSESIASESSTELEEEEDWNFMDDVSSASQDEEDTISEEEEENSISFIDDTDVEDYISKLDITNLSEDSIYDQLMKVSIQVHEEVFGKEKCHTDKLYVKNWFFHPESCIFNYACKEEDCEKELETVDLEILNEAEKVVQVKKEEIEYFGYALDAEDESEEQVDGTEYQLRRMMRERSFQVLNDYLKQFEAPNCTSTEMLEEETLQ